MAQYQIVTLYTVNRGSSYANLQTHVWLTSSLSPCTAASEIKPSLPGYSIAGSCMHMHMMTYFMKASVFGGHSSRGGGPSTFCMQADIEQVEDQL